MEPMTKTCGFIGGVILTHTHLEMDTNKQKNWGGCIWGQQYPQKWAAFPWFPLNPPPPQNWLQNKGKPPPRLALAPFRFFKEPIILNHNPLCQEGADDGLVVSPSQLALPWGLLTLKRQHPSSSVEAIQNHTGAPRSARIRIHKKVSQHSPSDESSGTAVALFPPDPAYPRGTRALLPDFTPRVIQSESASTFHANITKGSSAT